MGMEEAIKELYQRREKAKQMGGEERIKRQHTKKRLTTRQRIDKLLDPDSFWEMGMLNTAEDPKVAEVSACDGRIVGVGRIDDRRVAVEAQDRTIMGGSGGKVSTQAPSIFVK